MAAQLLGQQQLVEPDPRRRIIVPAGHGAWWGVDPGVERVAVAYVASDGRRGARTASFPVLRGGARLAAIWRETYRICLELVDGIGERWPRPGVVFVEHPFGKDPNPPLLYAVGVIQAAVYDALGCAVETIPSASWKLAACGRGDIYKPNPKKGRHGEYGVLTWARANGYQGSSYDEADALGIAEAARREVALDER